MGRTFNEQTGAVPRGMIDASLWHAYPLCRLSIGHLVKAGNRTACKACRSSFARVRAVKGAQLNLVDLVPTDRKVVGKPSVTEVHPLDMRLPQQEPGNMTALQAFGREVAS